MSKLEFVFHLCLSWTKSFDRKNQFINYCKNIFSNGKCKKNAISILLRLPIHSTLRHICFKLASVPNSINIFPNSTNIFSNGINIFQGYFSQVHNFPNVQFSKRQLPKSVLAAALGPLACSSLSARSPLQPVAPQLRRPNLTFGKLPLNKLHIWEVVPW